MAIGPQYRRVSALQRRFFNREGLLDAYDTELGAIGSSPRVLNVVGIGGIGKSRLLQELRNRTDPRFRTARLDLQVPALRQPEDALAVLRTEFGAQGVKFDRFDIAYAVLWQRVHPQLRMNRQSLPFVEDSEVLSKILDDAVGLPVFGTAAGLVRLAEKAMAGHRRRTRIKSDETLQDLDQLSNADLGHAVTYLFAQDLRESSLDRPYVLYVDAYEALVPAPLPGGRNFAADAWLRDLLGQLHGGLSVVASREPLRWAVYEPDWRSVIRKEVVEGLPMEARLQLLSAAGVTEQSRQCSIAQASAGVPFYLHLAVDTHLQNSGGADDVITSEHIVQRFLQHVTPDEIRLLELLSVSRTFSFEMFRAMGGEFGLPANLLSWESLTAYSFTYPVADGWYRLHQLMVAALQAHLPSRLSQGVHSLLRGYWEDLADQVGSGTDGAGISRSSPLREAVHHGLHAGGIPADRILQLADRAVVMGGRQAADGIVKDLREYLDAHPGSSVEVGQAADCLEAESLLALGDARAAIALVPEIEWQVEHPVAARLALAAANARRIAGESGAARLMFQRVWEGHTGAVRTAAGACLADIRMWQGDFAGAFVLAQEVYDMCAPDDRMNRADLKRLMHLGYRFLMDFEASDRLLREAEAEYRAANSVIGVANIKTNRAELLAFTDAAAAVDMAAEALESQQDLGAQHEIGKVYTAMAIAQTRLGQYDRARSSFMSACAALDRAGYRSGRARADLFLAFLLLREGDREAALSALRLAVAEFEACEVYPSLILAAHRIIVRLGAYDQEVSEAVARTRTFIKPLDSLEVLHARTEQLLTALLGTT